MVRVTCMGGEERRMLSFPWGDLGERGHLEDLGIEGRIVLKCIVKNRMGVHGLE